MTTLGEALKLGRPDFSKLPPPSAEFMVAMSVYREVVATSGKHSPQAAVAMEVALELAHPAVRESMANNLRLLGLVPDSGHFDEKGEPVFTEKDLAKFYGMDISALRAATHAAMNLGATQENQKPSH